MYKNESSLPSWGVMNIKDVQKIKSNKFPELVDVIVNKINSKITTNKTNVTNDLYQIQKYNKLIHNKVSYFPNKTHYDLFKLEDNTQFTYKIYIQDLNTKYNLNIDSNVINNELSLYNPLILAVKQKINKLRPFQASTLFNIPITLYESVSADTPALPSGHSIQGLLFGAILYKNYKQFFNSNKEEFNRLLTISKDIGLRRIMAGLHFPSDHKAAIIFVLEIIKQWNIPQYSSMLL